MTKRTTGSQVLAALLLFFVAAAATASERRHTPLVRAIERARTSVVNIHTEKSAEHDPLFTTGKGRKVSGMGTGIVLDERGYIVTNFHVVADVDSLRVTLDDSSSLDAQVISYDREHDLAIIKVEASRKLTVMPLGTSCDLMLGETVIAVGNAYGYEHTVTSGIVSALSRDVEVNEKQSYKNLIQTDASINPGNSGGPLLNLDGEVVGINVAIRAGAQRIGFAIPIDDARRVIARLLSVQELNSTYHGVVSRDLKSASQRICLVDAAQPESPAAAAGLLPGDIILQANDVSVTDGADLERALLGHAPGDTIEVRVRRGEQEETVTITLAPHRGDGVRDQSRIVARGNNDDSAPDRVWRIVGVRLSPLPSSERHIVGPRYRGGMNVTEVRAGSPAAKNGIRAGDILVGLHLWETVTSHDVEWILNQPQLVSSPEPLKFYLLRGRETLFGHLQLASVR